VAGDAALGQALAEHGEYVSRQVLAQSLELAAPGPGAPVHEGQVGEVRATIGLARA